MSKGPVTYLNQQRLPTDSYTKMDTYRQIRLPINQASTLIPDAYTSDNFFALEQEKIFLNSWVAVGCLPKVRNQGDILVTEVAGRSILVVRGKKNKLMAFYNVCRHRGSKLLNESCNVKRIRCPYHAWAYGLDGKCLGTPMLQNVKNLDNVTVKSYADHFDKENYGLYPVSVRSWGFLIFVNLNMGTSNGISEEEITAGFKEWLGDLPQKFLSHVLEKWLISNE